MISGKSFPKVSIVTPSYNQGRFLEETILSVLDQKYPNLEYIIIDGGSTDNSVEIIKKYEKHLAYWVSEKDSGQTEAINKGFRRCTGDIVAWINSDDIYLPNTFNFIVDYFIDHPEIDFVYGDAKIIDANGSFIMHRKEVPFDRTMGLLIGFGFLIPQPSTFWRRKIFESVGLLDEKLQYAMDSDLWAKVSEKHEIKHIPRYLSEARYHDEAKTVQILKVGISLAHQEWQKEIKESWYKLAIGKYISFNNSNFIRSLYRLKRIFLRTIRGHYFWGYKPAWYFKKKNA